MHKACICHNMIPCCIVMAFLWSRGPLLVVAFKARVFFRGSREQSSVTRRRLNKPATPRNQHKKQSCRRCKHKTTARSSAELTIPNRYPNTIKLHTRSSNPTYSRIKAKSSRSANISGMYIGMRPHAPGDKEPGHIVPAFTHRHTPPKGVIET